MFIRKTLYTMNRIVEGVIGGVWSELLQRKHGFMKIVRDEGGSWNLLEKERMVHQKYH